MLTFFDSAINVLMYMYFVINRNFCTIIPECIGKEEMGEFPHNSSTPAKPPSTST